MVGLDQQGKTSAHSSVSFVMQSFFFSVAVWGSKAIVVVLSHHPLELGRIYSSCCSPWEYLKMYRLFSSHWPLLSECYNYSGTTYHPHTEEMLLLQLVVQEE